MDRFFAILAEGVHRFEGTINQYTGDGIMALFGAPIAHEDHAQRACYAALHLRDELRALRGRAARRARASASRCAWASTRARSWSARSATTCAWTTRRRGTRSAWRRGWSSSPSRARSISPSTRRSSSPGYFQLRDLGRVRGQGRAASRSASSSSRAWARLRTRLDVSRARGFSRSSAAQSEMAALEAALERAIAGNGQVVGVVAEPGTGKSRLCYEFAERCRARGDPGLRGARRRPREGRCPCFPILELFRGYFGITEQDTRRGGAREDRRADAAARRDARARRCRSCSISSACPIPSGRLRHMDPEARQRQLFDVVRRVVHARAAPASRPSSSSRTCTGSTGERGVPREPRRDRARQPDAAARELPPRVPRGVDAEVVLPAAAAAAARRRGDRGAACAICSAADPSRRRLCASSSASARVAIRSSSRRSCSRWSRTGASTGARGAYRLVRPDGEGRRARHRAEPCSRRASTGCPSGRSRCCRRRR